MTRAERAAEKIIEMMRTRFDMKGPVATAMLRNEIILAMNELESRIRFECPVAPLSVTSEIKITQNEGVPVAGSWQR